MRGFVDGVITGMSTKLPFLSLTLFHNPKEYNFNGSDLLIGYTTIALNITYNLYIGIYIYIYLWVKMTN